MDKIIIKNSLSTAEMSHASIAFGEDGSLAIDQYPCAQANINPRTGFPYTDLQKVMLQQDLSERRRLLENLPSFKADFLDDKVSDLQAIKYMRPSNNQLPSEMAEKLRSDYEEQLEKVRIANEREKQKDFFDTLAGIEPAKSSKSDSKTQ